MNMSGGNAASPVNTVETLQRTSELAIEGIGKTKKLALLGSTVGDGVVVRSKGLFMPLFCCYFCM